MFAFGLLDDGITNVWERLRIGPDSRFIRWMLGTNRLTDAPSLDDNEWIALYFKDATRIRCRHAAIRLPGGPNGRMISKWGEYGVYEHAQDEVPDNYGGHILLVAKPSVEQAHLFFYEYVRDCQNQLPEWALPFGM
jgi:hypothetical protein